MDKTDRGVGYQKPVVRIAYMNGSIAGREVGVVCDLRGVDSAESRLFRDKPVLVPNGNGGIGE
jgi:hypothetical protein